MKNPLLPWIWLVCAALVGNAEAGVEFWDPEGLSAETAASLTGTWDNAPSWGQGMSQTASPSAWNQGDIPYFGAGPATVTNPIAVTLNSPVSISGFLNGAFGPGVFMAVIGSGSLSLVAGADAFSNKGTDGGTSTFNVPLTGPGQIILEGSNSYFFNASNSYTGGTTLGTSERNFTAAVAFTNGAAFGTGPIIMTFNGDGCTLQAEGPAAITLSNEFIAANVSINFVGNPAGLTLAGPWPLSTTPFIGSGGGGNLVTISGVVSGTGGIARYNSGVLVLSGSNTYAGNTVISNGILSVTADQNLGTPPLAAQDNVDLCGGTLNASNTFALDPHRTIMLTDDSAISVSPGQALSYAGSIAGPAALSKTGAGTLILSGLNGYTGTTTISDGTLEADSPGDATGTNTVSLLAGATLTGMGVVSGPVSGSGNIAPGTASGPASLTMGNGLDLSGGGVYQWNLSSDSTTSNFSIISLIGGDLNLGGSSTLSLNFTGAATSPDTNNPFWLTQEAWTVISVTGSAGNSSQAGFTTLSNGTYATGNFINYIDANGSVVLLYQPNFCVFDALFDSGPGFLGGENLIFTNFSGVPFFVWSSTNASLSVSNWTLVGQMSEQALAPQLPGYSRYSANIMPSVSPTYYVAGNINSEPYIISPQPVVTVTSADFVSFTVVNMNAAISPTGVLTLQPAPPLILPGSIYANGQFQFLFDAPINQPYSVQGSTDLVIWTNLTSGVVSDSPAAFIDPAAGNYGTQFYRIVLPP